MCIMTINVYNRCFLTLLIQKLREYIYIYLAGFTVKYAIVITEACAINSDVENLNSYVNNLLYYSYSSVCTVLATCSCTHARVFALL